MQEEPKKKIGMWERIKESQRAHNAKAKTIWNEAKMENAKTEPKKKSKIWVIVSVIFTSICLAIWLISIMGGEPKEQTSQTQAVTAIEEKASPQVTVQAKIVKIAAKPIEHAGGYTRFSWIVTVENISSSPLTRTAVISFFDKDNFLLETASNRDIVLQPGETKTFSAVYPIKTTVAENIHHYSVTLE